GDVVLIRVAPGSGGAAVRGQHRVVQVGGGQDVLGDVAAIAELHGGLAVAEEVVGGADARVDVVPARHALHLVEVARGDERAGIEVLRGHFGVLVVVADPAAQGEPLHRPLI